MTKTKTKVAIMAISLPQLSSAALIGIVPMAIDFYSHVSPTTVQTAFTVPMLACAFANLVVGRLASKIGKRIISIAGICLILAAGLVAALFDLPLVAFMAVTTAIGVGAGCLGPISPALINENFSGQAHQSLMGIQSAFVNMGGMMLTFVAGFLIRTGWRNAFFMYLLMIPFLIITIICLPPDNLASAPKGPSDGIKEKLGGRVLALFAVFFVFGAMFSIINTNAGLLVLERGLGDAAIASFASSVATGIGIVMGFVYGRLSKVFKRFTLPMSLVMFSVGMIIMANAPTLPIFYIGTFFWGTSVPTAIPTGFSIIAKLTTPSTAMMGMSGMLAAWFVALFISPLVVNPISYAIAGGTAHSRYMIGAVVVLALSVVVLCAQLKNYWHPKEEAV